MQKSFRSLLSPPKQAVVLVGGQGTRLGAWTKHTPKPMLPVGGRPFLEYLIWNLSRHGIHEIILSCGYLGEQIANHFKGKEGRWGKACIRCFIEPKPLGTGGALRFLAAELEEHFLLLNGDSIFDINYLDIPLLSKIPSHASVIVALRHVPDASRYGRVEMAKGQITHFLEKSQSPCPGLINAGVYWINRDVVARFPEGASAIERDLFPLLVSEGTLFGKVYEDYFIDIGVPDDYHRAGLELTSWKRKPTVFLDRDGVINVDHGYVHTPDRFEWIAGAPQAIQWCNNHGYLVVIVTNQSGIARGYYNEAQFHALTAWMQSELATIGAHIDATYYCPHHPTEGIETLRIACHCRKPNPGMLERALSEWEVDIERSLLIGDKPSDIEAAQRVGLVGHLFPGGHLDTFLTDAIGHH